MDDDARRQEALRGARIIADPRKSRDYVLVPGYPGGKDRIFLGTLGFRPHSAADAWELARLYEKQAQEQIASRSVRFGETSEHGLRCTIVVIVRGVRLRTGWIFRNDDVLWLTTPFSGSCVARRKVESMPLPEFCPVRLTNDRYVSKGVGRGAIGVILDVYDDGYDVEFSRPDGTTIALLFLKPGDIDPAPELIPSTKRLTV